MPIPPTDEAAAFNGAQVQSAVDIVVKVKAGDLDRESGIAMLKTFFKLTEPQAQELLVKGTVTDAAGDETTPEELDQKYPNATEAAVQAARDEEVRKAVAELPKPLTLTDAGDSPPIELSTEESAALRKCLRIPDKQSAFSFDDLIKRIEQMNDEAFARNKLITSSAERAETQPPPEKIVAALKVMSLVYRPPGAGESDLDARMKAGRELERRLFAQGATQAQVDAIALRALARFQPRSNDHDPDITKQMLGMAGHTSAPDDDGDSDRKDLSTTAASNRPTVKHQSVFDEMLGMTNR